MTVINVFCGTVYPKSIEIDLDKYGKPKPTNISHEDRERAIKLLIETMNDSSFASDGCRNEDAVNGCIALHVLGYDAVAWFDAFCAEQKLRIEWSSDDLYKFMEHVTRVGPYLSKWGPEGSEWNALVFALNY